MSQADIIERYLSLIADPSVDVEQIAELLDDDMRFVERPNLVNPRGSTRDVADVLASVALGRRLLESQHFEVVDHVVAGDTIATRAIWTGTPAVDAPPFPCRIVHQGRLLHALHPPRRAHRPSGELRLLPPAPARPSRRRLKRGSICTGCAGNRARDHSPRLSASPHDRSGIAAPARRRRPRCAGGGSRPTAGPRGRDGLRRRDGDRRGPRLRGDRHRPWRRRPGARRRRRPRLPRPGHAA